MSHDQGFYDAAAWEAGLRASTDAQRAQHAPADERPAETAPRGPGAPQGPLPEAPCSVTARVDFHGAKDVLLTFRGHDGRSTLKQLAQALDWIWALDAPANAPAPAPAAPAAYAQPANGAGMPQAGAGQVCPTHGLALKPSKNRPGEFYCPQKIADDNGAGKPLYCQFKVKT